MQYVKLAKDYAEKSKASESPKLQTSALSYRASGLHGMRVRVYRA